MRVELLLILGTFVISGDCGRRVTISESGVHESSRRRNGSLPKMSIGLVVPHTNFGVREYTKAVNRTVGFLRKGGKLKGQNKHSGSSFLDKYDFTQHSVRLSMMTLTPSPTGIYGRIIVKFLNNTIFVNTITRQINVTRCTWFHPQRFLIFIFTFYY